MSAQPVRLALVSLTDAEGVVTARRVSRDAAAALGFAEQDRTRIATAVSELARNAYEYARGGRLVLEYEEEKPALVCRVDDDGPGIIDVDAALAGNLGSPGSVGHGLLGVQRLANEFALESSPAGTSVRFTRVLPRRVEFDVAALRQRLQRRLAADAHEELELQNRELLLALTLLRARQEELVALNLELDETNRGVVALHRELDQQAERDRTISQMLQRSLMPEHLASTPSLQISAAHRSAGEGAIVGGDFYDVVDVSAGELWLFMGDVAGHGVETAAKANELRQSLRVYAREGFTPEEAFDRLNDLVLADDLVGLATACLIRIDASARTADVLLAGHPAPLLVPPSGPARLLDEERGPVLGFPGSGWRGHRHDLLPGSRLVLYTDGLIERVGETLDDGFRRLLEVGAGLDGDPQAALAQLFGLVPGDEPLRDDVALLLADVV